MTTLRGNVLASRIAVVIVAAFAVAFLSIGSAAAQSSGCAGGPFSGATALDSDGDGVNDGDEVVAGTNECDPNDTPTFVCGGWVTSYEAATADSDGDGHTDAAEIAAGTDPCNSTSVIAAPATTTTTTTAPPTNASPTAVAAPPQLALTGPSTAVLAMVVGFALMLVGVASVIASRRVEI